MQNKLTLALAITLGLGLIGCSSVQNKQTPLEQYQDHFMSVTPTFESVEPVLAEAKQKALDEPTQANIDAFNYVLGLKRLLGQDVSTGGLGIKYKQVSREPTLDWGNDERGGAAIRQPAYVHTLAGSVHVARPASNIYNSNKAVVSVPPKHLLSSSSLSLTNKSGANNEPKGLSMYELSRWERYCNNGKGMDNRDWDFVLKEGLQNVPSMLAFDCKPPATIGRAQ